MEEKQDFLWDVMVGLDTNKKFQGEIARGYRLGIKMVKYLSANGGNFSFELRNYLFQERNTMTFDIDRFVFEINGATGKQMPKEITDWLNSFDYGSWVIDFVNSTLMIYEQMFERVGYIRRWYPIELQEKALELYCAPILLLIDSIAGKEE